MCRQKHAESQKRFETRVSQLDEAQRAVDENRRRESEFRQRAERSWLVVQEAQKESVARRAEAEDWRMALDDSMAAASAAER